MSVNARIDIPYDEIAAFCRRHRIRKLSLFGSVIREDFSDDSDVDVLVEFERGQMPGLEYFRIQRELAEMLGREIQLLTRGSLSPHFRNEVLREALAIYDAAQ